MTRVEGVERHFDVGWKGKRGSVRTCDIYRRVTLWVGCKCRSGQESLLVGREKVE